MYRFANLRNSRTMPKLQPPESLRSKLLRVNSSERPTDSAYGFTSSNFRLNFSANIPDLIKVHSIVMKSCSIPNTEYNINESNNTFTFATATVPQTITILKGNYTITTLIAALVADALAIAVGMAITVSAPTGRLEFTFTTNSELLPLASGNNMAKTLGLTDPPTGDVALYLAPSLLNLSGLQNIYIVSKVLSGGASFIDPVLSQLAIFNHIQVTEPFGQYVHYTSPEEASDEIFFVADQTLNEIDFALFNDRGRNIDLQGLDWNMIVKIYYHVTSQK
jgi:hypothetical protein